MKPKSSRKIEEKLIQIAIKLARRGEGGLFVIITGKKPEFRALVKQNIKPFNILQGKNDKLIESLATIDGCVIINKKGRLLVYGVMIKSTVAFKGFGTRHAAALTASKNGNIAVLSSEEERKVKIFKNGRYLMQLDALEKNIEKSVSSAGKFLESIGAGFLGTVGAVTLLPGLGITIIPGVIIFGGSYYAIRSILDKFWRNK